MAAQIIDGKAVSAKVKEEVRQEIEREGLDVGLAVVIVGDDPASRVYVNNKKKACEVCGIKSYEYALPAETTEEQLMELIDALNADSKVNGILVQLPLPKHLNEEAVIARISPLKDVDAFSASNVGKIMIGNYAFLPCTPAGCMELIHSTGVDVSGKECVVIGRSNIVGKPMAMLLLHENGTVTICHSRTKNLKEVCARADILVAAVGRPGFVTGDMVKPGAVVIDVGINRSAEGKLCGDCVFDECAEKASYITPAVCRNDILGSAGDVIGTLAVSGSRTEIAPAKGQHRAFKGICARRCKLWRYIYECTHLNAAGGAFKVANRLAGSGFTRLLAAEHRRYRAVKPAVVLDGFRRRKLHDSDPGGLEGVDLAFRQRRGREQHLRMKLGQFINIGIFAAACGL